MLSKAYARDRRVIKSKDNSYSIKTIEYVPLDVQQIPLSGGPPRTRVANQEIDKLISEAKDRAEDIIQKAHLEAVNIKEEALQAGHEAGYEAAINEMHKAVDSISMAFKSGLEDIASLKDRILSQAEDDIVQLTIAIARKLVCRELEQHPDTIVAIVKEAVKVATRHAVSVHGKEITIEVHPDDYITLEQYISQLMEHVSSAGTAARHAVPIRIEENSALTPGGCVVMTDTNLIDMSFEARVESILRAFSNQRSAKSELNADT